MHRFMRQWLRRRLVIASAGLEFWRSIWAAQEGGWLTSGGLGRKVAQSGVKGRDPNHRAPSTARSIVGAIASGTVFRKVRAFARRQGAGDPYGEVPRSLRTRRLSDPVPGRVPVLVGAAGIRLADGGHAD